MGELRDTRRSQLRGLCIDNGQRIPMSARLCCVLLDSSPWRQVYRHRHALPFLVPRQYHHRSGHSIPPDTDPNTDASSI